MCCAISNKLEEYPYNSLNLHHSLNALFTVPSHLMGFLSPRSLLLSNVNAVLFPHPSKLPVMSPRVMEQEPWLIQDAKLYDICLKYLQQSPAHTATEAAQKLDALYPPKRTEDGDMQLQKFFVINVWDVILHMIRQIPDEHPAQDNLLELVEALRDLPTDIVVEIWSEKAKIWQDLPFLVDILETEYYSQ